MVNLDALLLHDGARASACGRVVVQGDDCWFEPPLPVPAVFYPPGREPAPKPSGVGVRVEGVDLERLSRWRQKDGTTEGWACLGGTWDGDRLIVREQGPDTNGSPGPTAIWELPPCPPPPGGWPRGGIDENIELEDDEDLDGPEVVAVTLFRPSSRQVVAVIASEDPSLTRRRLGASLGERLCVVPSKWTRAQVLDVRGQLDDHSHEWALFGCGESRGEDGQVQISAEVVRVLPAFAEFAAGVPDGLLAVDPWLAPD